MRAESALLWSAIAAYGVAGALAVSGAQRLRAGTHAVPALLLLGIAAHVASLAVRWAELGHGPFVTMYEILSSNVCSLLAVFMLAYWRVRAVRPLTAVVLPILAVMMVWLLAQDARPSHLPPTYDTGWLYVHVGFGKLFLGALLVAVAMGVVILARAGGRDARFAALPASARLDDLAYRFLAAALVCETLMLVAGAIWAQDAWGRYWDWDPLETWAFLTWLLLAFTLHLRATLRPAPRVGAALAIGVFVLAFVTFFGVPFVTTAPHQGFV